MEAATSSKVQENGKARTRNPEYLVFRVDVETGNLIPVSKSVKASSRKQAIVEATKNWPSSDPEGEYVVIPTSEYKIIRRSVRSVVMDEFS